MWHYRGGYVESKLKMNGSMQWAASDPSTQNRRFLCIRQYVHISLLVFYLDL
jgi:hypothetical protein